MQQEQETIAPEHLEIIQDKTQCLALVGHGKSQTFCKHPVKPIKGSIPLCFCSQKHMHLDEGLTRKEMYTKLYLLKQVGDEMMELESLVSSESFNLHKQLCDQIRPQIKRYKTLLAKLGEDHKTVRGLKHTYDNAMKYLDMWKQLNSKRDNFLDELGMMTTTEVFTTPLESNPGTPKASPSNTAPATPNRAKRTSPTPVESSAPGAKRVAPVVASQPEASSSMQVDAPVQPETPQTVYINAPQTMYVDASQTMYVVAPSPAHVDQYQVVSPLNLEQFNAALDAGEQSQIEYDNVADEAEEQTAENIDECEQMSDDEEPTEEDKAFIAYQ